MSLFDKLSLIGGKGGKKAAANEDISLDLKKISKLDSEGKDDAYIYTERRKN